MVFDVERQELSCPYCSSLVTLEAYTLSNAAQQVNEQSYCANMFLCPSCGAELTAPEEQTVAYCAYCGGEATLTQKQAQVQRPRRIIPFKKTKEAAVQGYAAEIKKKLYVPKEMKDAAFLEGFRGIYLPYWNVDVDIPPKELVIPGTKDYTKGGYDYHETYNVNVSIGGEVEGAVYDASAAFDDTLAAQIAPYDQQDARDFSEAYLAGFYADKVTTDPAAYRELALEQATEKVYDNIRRKAGGITLKTPATQKQRQEQIGARSQGERVSLFPVWFLTWRKGDRVAYSVMNGQSGKMSLEVPIDVRAFLLWSLAGAAVLFGVLSLMPVFIGAPTLSALSAVLMLLSGRVLGSELRRIRLQEQHTFDYGYAGAEGEKKPTKRKPSGGSCVGPVAAVLFYGLLIALSLALTRGSNGTVAPVYLLALAGQLVISIRIIRNAVSNKDAWALLPAIAGLLILGAGLWIGRENLAHDGWYYGLAIGSLAGMLLNILFAVHRFNRMVTRPVPNFFRREGANNARA